jgi:hypothetical protein
LLWRLCYLKWSDNNEIVGEATQQSIPTASVDFPAAKLAKAQA